MKRLVLSLFLFTTISLTNLAGQTIDTIEQIALNNRAFFVEIISRYYPLDNDQIEKYKDILQFIALSGNKKLKWDKNLINKYIDEWSYINLLRNKGINWNQKLVSSFCNEHWFNWDYLCYKRKVYLSKDFFADNSKNINHSLLKESDSVDSVLLEKKWEVNISNQNLLKYFIVIPYKKNKSDSTALRFLQNLQDREIHKVDKQILKKYSKYINQRKYYSNNKISWTINEIIDLVNPKFLSELAKNEQVINDLFISKINAKKVNDILTRFLISDSKKLHKISNQKRGHYFTGDVGYLNNWTTIFSKENQKLSYFPDTIANSHFEIECKFKEPEKYYDYHQFNSRNKDIPIRVVSPRLKAILEKFNLPKHRFYPIKLHVESHWWGSEERDYFVFLCDSTNAKSIDYDSIYLTKRGIISDSIRVLNSKEREELMSFSPKRIPFFKSENKEFKILNITLKDSLDLFNLGSSDIWISNRLYKCIIQNNIKGLNLYTNALPYISTPVDNRNTINFRLPEVKNDSMQLAFRNYKKINDSLQVLFSKSDYASFLKSKYKNPRLLEIEVKNEIILPRNYKIILLKNEEYSLTKYSEEYEYLGKNKLEIIDPSWHELFPMTQKGIYIAKNGLGDYLVLLLKENSPYELSDMIYKLEHEEGELIPFKRIN